MVERLKAAIEKARAQREAALASGLASPVGPERRSADPAPRPGGATNALLERLRPIEPDPLLLRRQRVVAADRSDPAHVAFDVLRTRVLRVMEERGWRRLLITSPSKGCGKSVVSANLAISIARHADARPLLIDLDLRCPRQAEIFGVADDMDIAALLDGRIELADLLRRYERNLALLLNRRPVAQSAEALIGRRMAEMIERVEAEVASTITIFDAAPMLVSDDVLGFLPRVDAVLLIAASGLTKPGEIVECERLLGDTPFLGVVLNKDEVDRPEAYRASYR